ncbi:MAG: CBS domain-containing protein [Paracoccaceae bacterium]
MQAGFWFALAPVAAGTATLVALGMAYARLTGRRYPFRQFDEPNRHGLHDPAPPERLGLSEEELTGLLDRYRQSFNLGVEDLARLIGAAELQAATHRRGPVQAGDIMSRDLVTLRPGAPLAEAAALFGRHRVQTLPVLDEDGQFLGLVVQGHLIRQAQAEAEARQAGLVPALAHLLGRRVPLVARDIMDSSGPTASAETPISVLLPMLADEAVEAVPVLAGTRIVGIVTSTDMIRALTQQALAA